MPVSFDSHLVTALCLVVSVLSFQPWDVSLTRNALLRGMSKPT